MVARVTGNTHIFFRVKVKEKITVFVFAQFNVYVLF